MLRCGKNGMEVEQILEKHGLSRELATRYIDAITRMNQSEAAEELDVTRQTISRYKNEFQEMKQHERLQLIASLTTEKLLEKHAEG